MTQKSEETSGVILIKLYIIGNTVLFRSANELKFWLLAQLDYRATAAGILYLTAYHCTAVPTYYVSGKYSLKTVNVHINLL